MAKRKGISFSDVFVTSFVLIAIVASAFGIYKALDYIKPDTTESSSENQIPGGPNIIPDLAINVLVDGVISDGYIEFENLNDSKVIEFRNKSDNTFYAKKISMQTAKQESFNITDMNGDGLYVRTQITIIGEEYSPVRLFISSPDFMFYVLVNLKSIPATSISIGDITFIENGA